MEYQIEFEIILNAGNSKSLSMEAMEYAKNGNFEKAEQLLTDASEALNNAHHVQTKLIQATIEKEQSYQSLLMIHAQDHLTMAMMTFENVKEFKELYKEIHCLKMKFREE